MLTKKEVFYVSKHQQIQFRIGCSEQGRKLFLFSYHVDKLQDRSWEFLVNLHVTCKVSSEDISPLGKFQI